MTATELHPAPLPDTRILGAVTVERQRLLALVDVVVGYVAARHRTALVGWELSAALVESRTGFRGGETVALRAIPTGGRRLADLPPVPLGALREIGSRVVGSLEGIANVVPDVSCPAPDVDGLDVIPSTAFDEGWWEIA